MSQLINSYPVFEGNQVLTSSQLNQMGAYLDEQNRLTRVKLIGSGTVCGLNLKLNTTTPPVIEISKGLGVTSEGYLMSVGDCELNRYRPYHLPSGMTYLPFVDPDTRQQDVELFELISIDQDVSGETDIKFLDEPSDFLSDKVVMLFYECVDDSLKSCLGQSCDDRGINRIFTLRKLLVSITDLENKIIPRTCVPDNQNNAKYNLPRFIIGEPRFRPDTPESSDYNLFSKNYVEQILNDTFISDFSPSSTSIYNALFDTLRQTYTDFAGILAPVYGGSNPFVNLPYEDWTLFLNMNSSGPRYLGVQYFYDFIKDLILAYNEFYDTAFEVLSECCPNMNCFPKHLLLGEVISDDNSTPSQYRNFFTPSEAISGNKDGIDKLVMLHKRMVLMTRSFDLDRINNPSTTPVPPSSLGKPVLITPSNEKSGPLSLRSIPYYYNINEAEEGLGTLESNWSYKYIKQDLFKHGLKPLAYGNQNPIQLNIEDPIKTPLFYDIDSYNFLRIEGAIRQSYIDVEDELDNLRTRFNLPFNYLTVRLSGEPFDNIEDRCNFEDINTQYLMLRNHIRGMSCNLFDRIAIIRRGVQIKPLPDFLNALIWQANSGAEEKGSVDQPIVAYTEPSQVREGTIIREASQTRESNQDLEANQFEMERIDFGLIPVYAIRRNMSEAVQYLQSNLLELARNLNDLCEELLPFNFSDFDFGYTGTSPNQESGFIQTYLDAKQFAINITVAQNQILDLIERSKTLSNTPELYSNVVSYFNSFKELINSFINDNEYKALTTLYYLYQYRIEYLRQNDIKLFSNFIKKNPGISHQAGVPKGGTYVMVVSGNPVEVNPPTREYAVAIKSKTKALKVDLEKFKFKKEKSFEDRKRAKKVEADLLALEGIQAELTDGVPIASLPTPNLLDGDQVIADFTLPYLINCDCSCDEIPAPTVESELNIPALTSPVIAEYSLGDYSYAREIQKSGGSNLMFIDVSDAVQYNKNRYSDVNIKLYLVDNNGVKIDFIIPIRERDGEQQSFQEDLMATYNHPNDPGNTVKYGMAGISYSAGKWSLTYRPSQSGNGEHFRGVDSFYYTFEIINPSTQAVLQNGTRSVVTVNVG